ncbi:MAG: general secretion pathway protein GspK [Desulfobacterales bacterium]|jgi:general secretion pathway protein K|nr:general secretion pathway protein GspK [Desulfobacteraceae bacterium]MBT7084562.1 general secretion pathway protein GspK [Desulfobacterales bacterium]MBT7697198.1 general secretion pathway protein GspK [Desulfobacterales bacterium]
MLVKKIKNERGVALLVTLSLISLLIVIVFELNRRVRSAVISSTASRDRITLMQMASSGIAIGMGVLINDKKETKSDSLQEDWANTEKIKEILEDYGFENGNITLKITDELSKIQVNALVDFPEGKKFNVSQKKLWDKLLRPIVSIDEAAELNATIDIINSVKDWLDSNDDDAITGLNGAESSYYESLDSPYLCRNGPVAHIDELLRIKGITSELFYLAGGSFGISKFLTVYGMTKYVKKVDGRGFAFKGKININTAGLPVIAALLPTGQEDLAVDIVNYRQETSDSKFVHNLDNISWYRDAPGCSDTEIDSKLITTESDFFRIESSAVLNNMKMKTVAIVQRVQNKVDKNGGKWKCRVLSWKQE